MRDILEEIIAYKRKFVKNQKSRLNPEELYARVERQMADGLFNDSSMRNALAKSSSGIIAEFKRKSPSKGWINPDASSNYVPLSYEKAGASAISILTDAWYFGGNPSFIRNARRSGVQCPILRKDFIIDEYQVFQARDMGANAILLIAACLTKDECKHLASVAHQLKLETLLEVHSEPELEYVGANIDMVGVNNRNLGTFQTDINNSFRLAQLLPKSHLLVSESGISNPQVVRLLRQIGFRGFLIGETFMKTADPAKALSQFIKSVTA